MIEGRQLTQQFETLRLPTDLAFVPSEIICRSPSHQQTDNPEGEDDEDDDGEDKYFMDVDEVPSWRFSPQPNFDDFLAESVLYEPKPSPHQEPATEWKHYPPNNDYLSYDVTIDPNSLLLPHCVTPELDVESDSSCLAEAPEVSSITGSSCYSSEVFDVAYNEPAFADQVEPVPAVSSLESIPEPETQPEAQPVAATKLKKTRSRRGTHSHLKRTGSRKKFVCNRVQPNGHLCGKTFGRPYDLARHYEIHNPNRPTFTCSHCEGGDEKGFTFSRYDALTRHLKNKHGIIDEIEPRD